MKFKSFFSFILAVVLTLGLSISFQSLLAAWTAPLANPPACTAGNPGCDAPLNIGPLMQTKSGGLWLSANSVSAYGLIVENGSVGIGTANPGAKLDVSGNLNLYGKDTIIGSDSWLRLNQSGSYASGIHSPYNMNVGGLTVGALYYNPGAGNLHVAGNVGIGTVSPSEKLEVAGNIKLSGASATYKIINLANPTAAQDAATKAYVDAAAGGAQLIKRVFVTSTSYDGTMGGWGGFTTADANCQARANAASLGGTWKAILGRSARARIGYNWNLLVNMAGEPLVSLTVVRGSGGNVSTGAGPWVAYDSANANYLYTPVAYNEFGSAVGAVSVWTGSNADGGPVINDCGGWTSSNPAMTGTYGMANATNNTWIAAAGGLCNVSRRIYCIEQ